MILSDAREQLYRAVVPHINSEDNVVRFNQYLNEIQERYINSGKWKGTVKEIVLPATDDFITLPPRFVSCLAVRYTSSEGGSLAEIRNQWFKYLPGGSYLWTPSSWTSIGYSTMLTDMGDGFCTFANSPYAQYFLKITRENTGDQNLQLLIKGYDQNGDSIHTDEGSNSYEGMVITLDTESVTTSQIFTDQITFVQKQPSQGFIRIEAVDASVSPDPPSTIIGRYMPGETVANYRRYATGGKAGSFETVNAICKLRYLPCKVDSDEVFPSNIGALKNGLAALKFEDEGDKESYKQFLGDGIQLLNDEIKEARGGAVFTLRIDPDAYQFEKLYQGH